MTGYIMEFTDTVSNKTYKKGEVLSLDAYELHSLKSDECILTISWEPAYE